MNRKRIRWVKRVTKRGRYSRFIIGKRVIFGKNTHQFKGRNTVHYHIGERFIKIVTKPKELRGIWRFSKKRRKYVRIGKKKD